MNLEIIKESDEKLLSRKDILAHITYSDATPSKETVISEISKKFKGFITVKKIDTKYGLHEAIVHAYIYDNKDVMNRMVKKGKKQIEKEGKTKPAIEKVDEKKEIETTDTTKEKKPTEGEKAEDKKGDK